ncbi:MULTISPECIES: AtpZ/AtpI family protein [unclassified Mesoflavibacter]|uniref:AtpZ/AtpI family protein n=1 Tax=unclassified Mesoflavibacter TaxID=2630131 RepID=UPI0017791C70|nr:AtpZ/AtpI family protein [Flavobacteriaceae bacterium]HIC30438.1 AtpZ/AtpI family protein [Flavobacteriaceae bacterium]
MEPQKPKKQLKQLAALTGIAIQMGVTIYLFVLLGKWLDSKYTESGKTFLIICTLAGVAISLYATLRQIKKLNP